MAEGKTYGIKKGLVVSFGALLAGILAIGGIAFFLTFRVTVPAGYIGVINAKTGQSLSAGQILAKPGEKGIREDFLSPGRYYFNPWSYSIEIHPEINIPGEKIGVQESLVGAPLPAGEILAEAGQQGIQREILGPGTYRINPYATKIHLYDNLVIPAGKLGVQTSQVGKPLPTGKLLADDGEKGVLRGTLTPGTYRINPFQIKVDIYDAINIPAGSVGVQVAKTGKIAEKESVLVEPGERGVQKNLLPAGMHYVNPYEYDVIVVSIQAQKLDMDANLNTNITTKEGQVLETEAVDFPSKDGFQIVSDVTVEWSIDPNRVAEVVATIGIEDKIIDKVIRPNARSISRTEGSKYAAKDFIVGIGREEFQRTFFDKMKLSSQDRGILIHRALIRKITVPAEISEPIKQSVIAVEENLRNQQRIETAKSAAQLAQEEALAEQNKRRVEGETKKFEVQLEAEAIAAQANIKAKQRLDAAKVNLESSEIEAQAILKTGTAEADVIKLKKTAEAEGLAASVGAFGDAKAFAMYQFASKLAPNIQVVFAPAGEGTLWNSLDDFFKIGETGAALKQMQQQSPQSQE